MAEKRDAAKKSGAKKIGAKKATSAGKKAGSKKTARANPNPFHGEWDSKLFPAGTIVTCLEPDGRDDAAFFVNGVTNKTSKIRHGRRPSIENDGSNDDTTITFSRPGDQEGDPNFEYRGTKRDKFPSDNKTRICGTFRRFRMVRGVKTTDETGDWMATRPPGPTLLQADGKKADKKR